MTKFKIGDKVQFVGLNKGYILIITNLPGKYPKHPDMYECKLPGEMGRGLYNPKYLRKLTRLELALK